MKKVLIITYYWPPSAGSGVQRWVKFAKYLPDFGWEPIIFTPENPDFQVRDETLTKDISTNLEVIKFPIWEPYQLQRMIFGKNKDFKPSASLEKKKKGLVDYFSIWVRGNLLIPDPRVFWVGPSVKFLSDIVKTNHIDAVITTGPPHSLHLIGLKLKEKTGMKWIADFRDPWTKWELLDTLYLTFWAKKRHRFLENKVLKTADALITISDTFKKDFEALGAKKVEVITNGFDPDDFKGTENIGLAEKFMISHIGTIDDLRDPRPFLAAAKDLLGVDDQLKKDLEILFVGVVSEKLVKEVKSDPVLSKVVVFKKYLPHKEVFKLYKQSAVLLLVLANSTNAVGNIPGKLFEYLASGRPVLALGRPDGDSAKILEGTKTGEVSNPENIDKIKETLSAYYLKWKSNEVLRSKGAGAYTRRALTEQLSNMLNSTVIKDCASN